MRYRPKSGCPRQNGLFCLCGALPPFAGECRVCITDGAGVRADVGSPPSVLLAMSVCTGYPPFLFSLRLGSRSLPMSEAAALIRTVHEWKPAMELVLNSVASPHTRRAYGAALTSFLDWYDRQGRPALSRAVVHAYKVELESGGAGAGKINQHLAAIRKLAREAAANGVLAWDAATAIVEVEGAKQRATRTGNWLTRQQAEKLLAIPDKTTLKGKRDRAVLGLLLGCGLRRSEVAALTVAHVGQRDGRWVIVDLRGKHGRVRSVAAPAWVKVLLDDWTAAAGITAGRLIRAVDRHGNVRDEISPQAVLDIVASCSKAAGAEVRPHDLRRTCAKLCRLGGAELEQIQLLLGHASVLTTERYLGTKQDLQHAPNDAIKMRII